MTGDPPLPGVDPGLLARFRHAGSELSWSPAGGPSARPARGGKPSLRTWQAELDDETARIEERPDPAGRCLRVESCPVGALVLLLEIDRSGRRPRLRPLLAGEAPGFPNGALEAVWGDPADPSPLPLGDLVALARFALP